MGPFSCAGLLQLLGLFDGSPGLPLASAVPNIEWNHLIKAGSVSKMWFEHSNLLLICSPEPPSARRVLPWFFTAWWGPCTASPSFSFCSSYKMNPETWLSSHSSVSFWTFIDVTRGEVNSQVVAQLMEISENVQGPGGLGLCARIRAWMYSLAWRGELEKWTW